MLYSRVQGDQPVGGDAKRPAVHVGNEELSAQTRREGIPESGGTGTKPGAYRVYGHITGGGLKL